MQPFNSRSRLNMNYNSFFKTKYFLLIACFVVLGQVQLISQESVKIGRFSDQVNFDGHPDEDVWKEATVFPLIVSTWLDTTVNISGSGQSF